ncbi:DUF4416 family protein [bacterium]|nr:DUF4416 family protein [bacterium]
MGIIQERDPVKLVTSIFSRDKNLIDSVIKMLVDKFGKIDFETELLDFNQTDYYEKEMGKTLLRKFVSFEGLIEPNSISNIKIYTNELEKNISQSWKTEEKRDVNIDPGYLSLSKLVLASTKDFYHRIYLNHGIYAEITLVFKKETRSKGSFQPFQCTYPDYASQEYRSIFNQIRKIYKGNVKIG